MGVTNHSDIPLAIKIVSVHKLISSLMNLQVKKEDMADLERELIARTNKKGFTGFPT